MRSEAERAARVIFIVSPVQAERIHVREQVSAQGGDEWNVRANGIVHSRGEGVFREVLVSGFVHGVSLAPDDLAGHDEGFAWSCSGFVEFDASFVIGFDGEDEGVDFVAKLNRELEERAGVLGIDYF